MAVQTEVERLVRKLKSRRPAVREQALADLRALGPEAVDELLQIGARDQRRAGCSLGCWSCFAWTASQQAVQWLGGLPGWGVAWPLLASVGLTLVAMLIAYLALRTWSPIGTVALALAQFDDPRAVRALASAIDTRHVSGHPTVLAWLSRWLPRLSASDDDVLDRQARSALVRHLLRAKPAQRSLESDMTILEALSKIGDRTTIEALRPLRPGTRRRVVSPALNEAAEACAAELERRQREADWGNDEPEEPVPVDLQRYAERLKRAGKEAPWNLACGTVLLVAVLALWIAGRSEGLPAHILAAGAGGALIVLLARTPRVPVDVERALTRMVARWRSPELIGPTAEGLALDYVRDTCAVVLARMLPRIDPERPPELSAKQRGLLWAELRRPEAHAKWRRDLVLALLPALAHIGDTQALEAVRRLAAGSGDAEVRVAASAAIPGIEALLRRSRDRDTLLTPAAAPSEEVPLLRPSQAHEAEQVLLRPADGE